MTDRIVAFLNRLGFYTKGQVEYGFQLGVETGEQRGYLRGYRSGVEDQGALRVMRTQAAAEKMRPAISLVLGGGDKS